MKSTLLNYIFIDLLMSGAIVGLFNLSNVHRLNAVPDPHHHSSPTEVPVKQTSMKMIHSDRHFLEMMIYHHQNAIEIAKLASNRSKHSEVKMLSSSILQTQTREIDQMKTWYKMWYDTDVTIDSKGMMQHHLAMMKMHRNSGMMGMYKSRMSIQRDLMTLNNSPDFDREFIRQMIAHHQIEIHIAQMHLKHSTHLEVKNLAQSMIEAHRAEISQMQQWIQQWN
jgi:uncharacterized protein (DUF305 family)